MAAQRVRCFTRYHLDKLGRPFAHPLSALARERTNCFANRPRRGSSRCDPSWTTPAPSDVSSRELTISARVWTTPRHPGARRSADGYVDMMIGAQALAWDLILITNDQAFRRIKKLKMEDWTKRPENATPRPHKHR